LLRPYIPARTKRTSSSSGGGGGGSSSSSSSIVMMCFVASFCIVNDGISTELWLPSDLEWLWLELRI